MTKARVIDLNQARVRPPAQDTCDELHKLAIAAGMHDAFVEIADAGHGQIRIIVSLRLDEHTPWKGYQDNIDFKPHLSVRVNLAAAQVCGNKLMMKLIREFYTVQ